MWQLQLTSVTPHLNTEDVMFPFINNESSHRESGTLKFGTIGLEIVHGPVPAEG
jgi:hypothetical protein